MGNSHGREDTAPGSVGTVPWSRHPSSASVAGNGHLQAQSGVSRGERLWRHRPPTLRPGPMGMRKETPQCPQPEGTHSCPSLADAHSGISPTAQPSSTLVLSTTGEPAPNPQENLFPRAESLRDSRDFPGHSDQWDHLLHGDGALGSTISHPNSRHRIRDKASPGHVTEQSRCSLHHTHQVLRCVRCDPPAPKCSRGFLTSCAHGRGSPGSESRAAAPDGRCETPGTRRTPPGGRCWEQRNKHNCSVAGN